MGRWGEFRRKPYFTLPRFRARRAQAHSGLAWDEYSLLKVHNSQLTTEMGSAEIAVTKQLLQSHCQLLPFLAYALLLCSDRLPRPMGRGTRGGMLWEMKVNVVPPPRLCLKVTQLEERKETHAKLCLTVGYKGVG